FNLKKLNIKDEAKHIYIEIDYFDIGNFIENKIQELTVDMQIEGVAETDYQTYLLVNLDAAMTQNMMAKDIANLVVAKIEIIRK
ncbi:30127_t:CDS:1, partial [Racocetra persica]